jgi:hypothetical protein
MLRMIAFCFDDHLQLIPVNPEQVLPIWKQPDIAAALTGCCIFDPFNSGKSDSIRVDTSWREIR